ncbi:hypothetical protein [Turneriella parva]|uniref:Uncharacterized protein n=1 Tax=Turneriella parva (strain ATCC BAA-1111 / DSM 21527 / NCTC 11395 / H) TaxID=869212 RepID=I4B0C8_TURPD|nr:hypothetical protein [Turneriella parva]AFM10735.1 hypothetical protein Turpa_0072 [Turneriella parva DSM 21527]
MQQFIQRAITSGLTRGEAYTLWLRAVQVKQAKVFAHLLKRIEQGDCDWTEVSSAARVHRLDQDKFIALKRRYYAYSAV